MKYLFFILLGLFTSSLRAQNYSIESFKEKPPEYKQKVSTINGFYHIYYDDIRAIPEGEEFLILNDLEMVYTVQEWENRPKRDYPRISKSTYKNRKERLRSEPIVFINDYNGIHSLVRFKNGSKQYLLSNFTLTGSIHQSITVKSFENMRNALIGKRVIFNTWTDDEWIDIEGNKREPPYDYSRSRLKPCFIENIGIDSCKVVFQFIYNDVLYQSKIDDISYEHYPFIYSVSQGAEEPKPIIKKPEIKEVDFKLSTSLVNDRKVSYRNIAELLDVGFENQQGTKISFKVCFSRDGTIIHAEIDEEKTTAIIPFGKQQAILQAVYGYRFNADLEAALMECGELTEHNTIK